VSAGAGSHKVKPANRIKAAWRLSGTSLSLRTWLKKQNGQIEKWAWQWDANKRR